MIDFLLAWSTRRVPQAQDQPFIDSLKAFRGPRATVLHDWAPQQCPRLRIWAWGHDAPPLDAADRVRASHDGFSLFDGWLIPQLGKLPLASVLEVKQHFSETDEAHGEYAFVAVDPYGNGIIRRNLFASVQLYCHVADDLVVISTRASMVAAFLHHGRPAPVSSDFVRSVGNYSVALSSHALFEGVHAIPQGASIRIAAGHPAITPPKGDPLFDADLATQYARDRRTFWDGVYERMIGLMRVVEATDLPIHFPLSGGKDSRLLLGLVLAAGYKDRIAKLYTNGPRVSPEVTAASLIAEHVGIEHDIRLGGQNGHPDQGDITSRLPVHLFISEGEMSPMDLLTGAEPRRSFELHGQEAGLRNIAGKRDFASRDAALNWFELHLGQGDICGIFLPEAKEQNLADIQTYIERAEADGTPYSQMPTRHRVEHRMARWVGRVWSSRNSVSFSPFVFVSEMAVRATYNAGHRSRYLEEFHFEMLRRIDPKLVEIPFAGQTWDDDLLTVVADPPAKPEPLSWPPEYPVFSRRPMFQSLLVNFDAFKRFVRENAGPAVRSVVDLDRLAAFGVSDLKSGHVQPLWQVFQACLAEQVPSFSALRGSLAGLPPIPNLDRLVPEVDERAVHGTAGSGARAAAAAERV
jgi:hypothetical protein